VGPLTFGVVICHEGWRYPERVRWAVRRGAQLVFHPHAHVAEPGSYRPVTFADPANTFHEKATSLQQSWCCPSRRSCESWVLQGRISSPLDGILNQAAEFTQATTWARQEHNLMLDALVLAAVNRNTMALRPPG
jgi:hypothetical protein